jgi:hypothetical protein
MPKKKSPRAFRKIPAHQRADFPITILKASGKTKVVPNRVDISVGHHDGVVWNGAAAFVVDFHGDSPFVASIFTGGPGHPAYSGPAKAGCELKDYKYSAVIAGASEVDPIIHTDP